MDLNIGSKETELLIRLLNEFENGPYCLNALVEELMQKGYCKNRQTAYRYANRILAIRKIIQRRIESEVIKRRAETILNKIIMDPDLMQKEKLDRCYFYLDNLWGRVKKSLNFPPENADVAYNKLRERGLLPST